MDVEDEGELEQLLPLVPVDLGLDVEGPAVRREGEPLHDGRAGHRAAHDDGVALDLDPVVATTSSGIRS